MDMITGQLKGRGAVGNPAGRFEQTERLAVDDGWWAGDDESDLAHKLLTKIRPDAARSVITRNQSPDIPFDRSINPYRGCEHGCVYCFARPSHSFLDLSPGLDFETRIFFKEHAAKLLEKELRKPRYKAAPMALGVNTDCYQPAERELKITRSILEVLDAFNHPLSIITKSAGILRDLDILTSMAERNLVHVMISVTTLDRELARKMEPRAATPERRLKTMQALNNAGVPTGVLASPMIPGLNDPEIEKILTACAEAGAVQAGYLLLRLPYELKDMFTAWLEAHYPDRARHVLSLIRQCRSGNLNNSEFGQRFTGEGPYAEIIRRRFHVAQNKLGIPERTLDLDCSHFEVPLARGDQMGLF
ncbi:MAG: PA0069 family radical SAM protein [Rhodospirillaceae bacterium]|nr:PA0069 family radical SAM protein [Rhodospirillaceae bacterium]MBT7957593.1 PA0069 family radical SAM protein [Rhodospirillaceae bacterium]